MAMVSTRSRGLGAGLETLMLRSREERALFFNFATWPAPKKRTDSGVLRAQRAATPLAAFERISEAFPSPYRAEDDVDIYVSEA